MGDLIYSFASLAARCHHGTTCLRGMQRLADTLHPHGVKITWIVSAESAHAAAGDLTRWHEAHGDDVAVYIPEIEAPFDERKRLLKTQQSAVREALPWADLSIAAGGHRQADVGALLDSLGFKGLWGFCWEQIEVDQITDRGCPWGFYYMDPEERLRPAHGRGVIGMEWTARDLLKSFHSGNPCLYSTDPNDVARGGICSWENIDYWKGLADNYIRNTRYNGHVFLLQHQEAHEMERSEHFMCYTDEDIRESVIQLDAFVRHIKDKAVMMTLPEAAHLYRERYEATPTSYMLWEDTPTPPHNPDYAWNMPCGPWPKTFLYYDRGAQMMFIEGKVEPVCIRNYARPWEPASYFAEPDIPRVRLVKNSQHSWHRELALSVMAPRAMPFGLALWGDYRLYQVAEAPSLLDAKILAPELLFLRCDLAQGQNVINVLLEGK
ncbi:MAG TPA: hypothetical protein ENN80_08940 [Candidatus Hydrogenedentes bacterium]|nr:hypothetical protein [Candidatus Hydrogenedentota bacterium]